MGAGAGGWGAGVLVSCQTPAVARRRGDEHNDPFCEGTKERGGEREALILPYICLALQGNAFVQQRQHIGQPYFLRIGAVRILFLRFPLGRKCDPSHFNQKKWSARRGK